MLSKTPCSACNRRYATCNSAASAALFQQSSRDEIRIDKIGGRPVGNWRQPFELEHAFFVICNGGNHKTLIQVLWPVIDIDMATQFVGPVQVQRKTTIPQPPDPMGCIAITD